MSKIQKQSSNLLYLFFSICFASFQFVNNFVYFSFETDKFGFLLGKKKKKGKEKEKKNITNKEMNK